MSACNSVSHTLRSLEDALTRGSIHSKIITKTVAPCHSLSSALRKQLFTLHCCSLRRDLIPGKSRPRWASGLASTHAAGQRGACALPSPDHLVSRSRFIQILVAVALLAVSPSIASSTETQLPKNYVKFARKLLDALRDSIEVDLSPASENEVRRKADPAKGLVKEWVQNWRDARAVSKEVSYRKITESLQLLGEFYLNKGQRSRLPPQLGSDILRRLDAAAAALPLD